MKQVLQITISTKEENEKTVGILEISSKKKNSFIKSENYTWRLVCFQIPLGVLQQYNAITAPPELYLVDCKHKYQIVNFLDQLLCHPINSLELISITFTPKQPKHEICTNWWQKLGNK